MVLTKRSASYVIFDAEPPGKPPLWIKIITSNELISSGVKILKQKQSSDIFKIQHSTYLTSQLKTISQLVSAVAISPSLPAFFEPSISSQEQLPWKNYYSRIRHHRTACCRRKIKRTLWRAQRRCCLIEVNWSELEGLRGIRREFNINSHRRLKFCRLLALAISWSESGWEGRCHLYEYWDDTRLWFAAQIDFYCLPTQLHHGRATWLMNKYWLTKWHLWMRWSFFQSNTISKGTLFSGSIDVFREKKFISEVFLRGQHRCSIPCIPVRQYSSPAHETIFLLGGLQWQSRTTPMVRHLRLERSHEPMITQDKYLI